MSTSASPAPPHKLVSVPVPAGDEILNIPALSGRLGVSQRHLHALIRDGRIPCIRVGRSLRFRWSAVIAALSE